MVGERCLAIGGRAGTVSYTHLLMEEMDAESFYGMKYAQERDEEREAKGLD